MRNQGMRSASGASSDSEAQPAGETDAELPLLREPPAHLEEAELRRRFVLERELADALRRASAGERPALYAEVYETYYRALGEGGVVSDPTVAKLQLELLQPLLEASPERRAQILEIGAGDAQLARALCREGHEVTVVEASRGAAGSAVAAGASLARTKSEGSTRQPRWVDSTKASDVLEPASFDLVFSSHFVEHLHPDDLAPHLRQTLEWAKPGGRYVVITPNRLCGPHDVSGYFSPQALGFHLREYTHGELARQMQTAGWSRIAPLVDLRGSPRPGSLLRVRFLELVLGALGSRLRTWLYDHRWAARRPFRPLEQVVLVASRPPRRT